MPLLLGAFPPLPLLRHHLRTVDADHRPAVKRLRMRARGVVFTDYKGLSQDELGIWTAPDGQSKEAWFADPDDNALFVKQA